MAQVERASEQAQAAPSCDAGHECSSTPRPAALVWQAARQREYEKAQKKAQKKAAEEAIPEEYLANSSLIGPEGFVRERLHALKDSGVTSLNINLMGQAVGERVTQLEKLRNLVDSM